MISENIRLLRKTHDLTQTEFAKIIGISRNSLVRYENGTSPITTQLIDTICQKFNVAYTDIVGEEKMLTPIEEYDLTVKIEVIKEIGANVLGSLFHVVEKQEIDITDKTNPWMITINEISAIINTKLYQVTNPDEAERYLGYIQGTERMIQAVELVA
ncbi:helix-turn-helix domain-containing protein [Streptococcus devriesei]|uniref:helix-turn-helix domain-containing protein n=1 Tax=Streptococcus devriesei TaxID=231233 RepID=UPI00041E22AC|nr:helix-turn-helix transcriptional regulator [Streptococcus devriesei]